VEPEPGSRRSVGLVCMPWHMLGSPSIQLGTLHALLERSGIPCRSHSFHLELASFLGQRLGLERGFSLDDYGRVCGDGLNVGLGEWLFAPRTPRRAEREQRYRALCRSAGLERELLERLARARALVPEFLERCADEILAHAPALVGFTLVYSQTLPSAALARLLKARVPDLRIVCGGTACEGPMGPALLRAFECVDLVVRGEAEGVIEPLARSVIDGAPLPELPGLCSRNGAGIVERPMDARVRVRMDDVPVPEYGEYFERLAASPLAPRILPRLPLETSRGCWWGEKHHCTFCGLNGLEMAYRSKSPQRALTEVEELARRHGILDFTSVDNILDLRYFDGVLEPLARRGADLSFFFETKSNLRREQVERLRAAGVLSIQPGIESLSTPILELMRKGVTAFQNLRLLKWCAEYGIHPIWNLLYGFPGEPREEYERMARLVPSLVHLPAPTMGPLMIYRFSPYHEQPEAFGLALGAPLPYYELLYDADARCLAELAQVFGFEYRDGRDPEAYVGALREQVERWRSDAARNAGALTYRRGPGIVVVTDTRTTGSPARYELSGEEAAVFSSCDSGTTVSQSLRWIRESCGLSPTEERVRAILAELAEARLVYEEQGRFLSLALSFRRSAVGGGSVEAPRAADAQACAPACA
jgi:ribosomal peptide maturation radical SAM protein 1